MKRREFLKLSVGTTAAGAYEAGEETALEEVRD